MDVADKIAYTWSDWESSKECDVSLLALIIITVDTLTRR